MGKVTDPALLAELEKPVTDPAVLAQLNGATSSGPATMSGLPDVGRWEGARRKFYQGATFGFADEIGGGANGVADYAKARLAGRDAALSDAVKQGIEEWRARDDAAGKLYPAQSAAATLAGGVTTGLAAPLPFKAAPAAGGLGQAAAATGNAAAGGALYGFGDTKGGIADRAEGALHGGEAGAKVGGLLSPLVLAAQKAAAGLRGRAGLHWFKTTGAGSPEIANVGGVEKAREVGRGMRDMRVTGPLSSAEKVHERVIAKQAELDPEFNAIPKQLDADVAALGRAGDPALSFDVNAWAQQANQQVIAPNRQKTLPWAKAADGIEEEVVNQMGHAKYPAGTMDLDQALNNLRRPLKRDIDFGADDAPSRHLNTLKQPLYGLVNDEFVPKVGAAAQATGNPEAAARFADLNQKFATLGAAEGAAFTGANRAAGAKNVAANNIAGLSAITHGNVTGAIQAAGALHAIRSAGQGATAGAMDAVAAALNGGSRSMPGQVAPLARFLTDPETPADPALAAKKVALRKILGLD